MKRFYGIVVLFIPVFVFVLGFYQNIEVLLLLGTLVIVYILGVVLGMQSYSVYQKWPSKYSYWYLAIGIFLVLTPMVNSMGINKEPEVAVYYVFASIALAMVSVVIAAYYLITIDYKTYKK